MNSRIEYINPVGSSPAQGLYSHATRVFNGPLLFVSGQLSVASDGSVAGKGDFDAQFRQVFGNLATVLKGLGVGFDDVIKFTTFLVDSQDIEKFMRLRADLFPKIFTGPRFPPNTLLIVNRLVKEDFLLEVEAIASDSTANNATR